MNNPTAVPEGCYTTMTATTLENFWNSKRNTS